MNSCLQEGISQEAISFAGLHKLNKLIMFYDANNVTLDGALDISFNEDVLKRFQASNWNTILVKDGNDINAILTILEKINYLINKIRNHKLKMPMTQRF
ncbi:MAG: hypothetical protein SOZ70_06940 [Bacilli bacterium]|nr:hypothetical protein [Bacilli bacterium]